jgi:hypothetical protein
VAPKALALLAGRRRQADARVIDFCLGNDTQLTCAYGKLAQCDVPLSLYSVSCFSPRSIDFGGVVVALGFSATAALGRAFSSCLRKGLRMIGIVSSVCMGMLRQSYARKMLFVGRGYGKAQYVHNATVVRSHSAVLVAVEIEWARRLSDGGELRPPGKILGTKKALYYYAGMGVCYLAKWLHVGMEGSWSGRRRKRAVLWVRRMG